MNTLRSTSSEKVPTVIVGGGQAGLAVGHFLHRCGRGFVILDAHSRVGDGWRGRWDSLRLFTPAAYSSLPGLPFPAPPNHYPSKDEMADYLEAYATRLALPVRLNTQVARLERHGDTYLLTTSGGRIEADTVVVATGAFQTPKVPPFAGKLDPAIRQLHSSQYRNPRRLPDGPVLVVGAGNSGAQISMELAASRPTYLAGKIPGSLPQFPPWLWWVAARLLLNQPADSWLGRGFRGKGDHGDALVGIHERDIARAGVRRVGRVAGVRGGKPLLADGTVLEVSSVVWCTGFRPDFTWIHLPVFDTGGYPVHTRGVVEGEPGLYFVGLRFLYRLNSSQIYGVGADAAYIAKHIVRNHPEGRRATAPVGTARHMRPGG